MDNHEPYSDVYGTSSKSDTDTRRVRRRSRGIPHTSEATAFPLGGIGTGNVSIGARGELRDWELENHQDKGRDSPYSFFSIFVKPEGEQPITRVLEARRTGRLDRDIGFSFDQTAGLPRLESATLFGEYPVVEVDFDDDELPVIVTLRAFTPLVPLDADRSGVPGAVLRYSVTNPGRLPVDVTVAGSMSHTAGRGDGPFGMRAKQSVRFREQGSIRGLDFGVDLPEDDFGYGTLSLTTTADEITVKPQWVTGFWPDGSRLFWDDLSDDGMLDAEPRLTLEDRPRGLFGANVPPGPMSEEDLFDHLPRIRTGSLGIPKRLLPGETAEFEFVLSWCFPNRHRAWQGHMGLENTNENQVVKNHYATLWPEAWAASEYLHENLAELESITDSYVDSLYDSTLDPAIIDAIGANVAALRSTTCFVVESPNPQIGTGPVFAAWEGSFDHGGACEGTCTHVWSYAQTAAYLFPSLERSARRVEFLLETDGEGAQKFRTNRVFGGPPWYMAPAVDGQLGTFLRLYREWKFSGDDDFLKELWPAAVSSLEYATTTWDRNGDGLLDGELHNTYDIEFYGIDPLANGIYLAALRSGEQMAGYLGERELAARWHSLAATVAEQMDTVLWNGAWYRQVLDDVDEHRYQYGEGVLSDQLLGQYHAYVTGLGEILPRERVRSALRSIFQHNFRTDLSHHESTQRVYALNDEGGLLLASWPTGGRPRIPFIYSDEVWTGIEHQVAASLAFADLTDEAVKIGQSLRARYDGSSRSPWCEIEWGNHYARSLASWSLLLAFTGTQWDAPSKTLSFDPRVPLPMKALFTTGDGWGSVTIEENRLIVRLLGGRLDVKDVRFRGSRAGGPLVLEEGDEAVIDLA